MPVDNTLPVTQEVKTRCLVELGHRIDEFAPRVFAWMRRRYHSDTLAEDAVIEALTEAVLRILWGESIHNLEAWVRTAARHTADRVRQRQMVAIPDGLVLEAKPVEDRVISDEVRQAVTNTVDALPELIRETARRYYLSGQTYEQIAEALGVSTGSVSKRLSEARKILHERLLRFEDFDR